MRRTREKIIDRFLEKHGDYYIYDLVEYLNGTTKVNIICKKHGLFKITPNSHLNGSGCYKCGREKCSKARHTNLEFIDMCEKVHKGEYDYSKTVYDKYEKPVTIICKKHGEFSQKAKKHLGGDKCKKCVSESYYCDFKKMCLDKYTGYSYDKMVYKGMFSEVIITCDIHGDFLTKPVNFYHKGRTCKKCKNKTKSKIEEEWLNSLNIDNINRNVYITFGSKTFCVDGIDFEGKVIYEFYGDFFHGNPEVYKEDDINPLLRETYGSLYKKTMEKEEVIKLNGYRLVTIWENEFKRIK